MAEARAGLDLESNNHLFHWNLGWALAALGRPDEAVKALRHAAVLSSDDPTAQAFVGWALGLAGERQEALAIRTELEQRRAEEYFSSFFMAMLNVGLGESDQAISWLQDAAEQRERVMPFLSRWPAFDPLRPDPRFQALLRRMNFPETAPARPSTPSTP